MLVAALGLKVCGLEDLCFEVRVGDFLRLLVMGRGLLLYAVAVCCFPMTGLFADWFGGLAFNEVLVALALDGLPILTGGQNVPPKGGSWYGFSMTGLLLLLSETTREWWRGGMGVLWIVGVGHFYILVIIDFGGLG